jgi:hypothetical protein
MVWRDLIWHGGEINGFCSAILRYPEDRTLVVVLENRTRKEKATPIGLAIAPV